jgi:hypothetical protein
MAFFHARYYGLFDAAHRFELFLQYAFFGSCVGKLNHLMPLSKIYFASMADLQGNHR